MVIPSSELGSTKKIMVIDDDPDILVSISLYLSEFGYTVTTAKSGSEALRRLTVESPDLILLDLMMPGMSGTELMVRLRDMGIHVPIVIISADVDARRRLRGHQQEGLLIKPFAMADMKAAVEKILSGGAERPARLSGDARR
jgi:DNA-binding response OmpR family regulator